jgi:hypothetical protein
MILFQQIFIRSFMTEGSWPNPNIDDQAYLLHFRFQIRRNVFISKRKAFDSKDASQKTDRICPQKMI